MPFSLFCIGSNKRLLTISKLSGPVAGLHCLAILVTTFFNPLQAISPSLPPISSILCGIEIKTRAFETRFADSVNSWAKLS